MMDAFCWDMERKGGRVLGVKPAVQPMSHAAAEWLHAPFDVSETRISATQAATTGVGWLY